MKESVRKQIRVWLFGKKIRHKRKHRQQQGGITETSILMYVLCTHTHTGLYFHNLSMMSPWKSNWLRKPSTKVTLIWGPVNIRLQYSCKIPKDIFLQKQKFTILLMLWALLFFPSNNLNSWMTGSPQLMTIIHPAISIISHDGHKAGHHMAVHDFKTFFAVVVKWTYCSLSPLFPENQRETLVSSKNVINCCDMTMGHWKWP